MSENSKCINANTVPTFESKFDEAICNQDKAFESETYFGSRILCADLAAAGVGLEFSKCVIDVWLKNAYIDK